jgi:hypothetical protein
MRAAIVLAIALAASPSRCGPTNAEAGQAVLLVSPLVLLVGLGLLRLLFFAWRGRWSDGGLRLGPNGVLFALLVLIAIGAAATSSRAWGWAGFALWLFGCSYLSLLLLAWRIWFFVNASSAFRWAPTAAMVPNTIVSLVTAAGWIQEESVQLVWVAPGYGGWISGGLFLVLLVEAIVRGRARRRGLNIPPTRASNG